MHLQTSSILGTFRGTSQLNRNQTPPPFRFGPEKRKSACSVEAMTAACIKRLFLALSNLLFFNQLYHSIASTCFHSLLLTSDILFLFIPLTLINILYYHTIPFTAATALLSYTRYVISNLFLARRRGIFVSRARRCADRPRRQSLVRGFLSGRAPTTSPLLTSSTTSTFLLFLSSPHLLNLACNILCLHHSCFTP